MVFRDPQAVAKAIEIFPDILWKEQKTFQLKRFFVLRHKSGQNPNVMGRAICQRRLRLALRAFLACLRLVLACFLVRLDAGA